MRIGPALLVLLSIGGLIVLADQEPAADGVVRREVSPDEGAWAPHESGLQVQVLLPQSELAAPVTSLPVVIWFRNPTDGPITLQVVAPAFTAHGEVEVRDGAGVSRVALDCCKKHTYEAVLFAPGQMRGFLCDALAQSCCRVPEGGLEAGAYTVGLPKAEGVELRVR